MASFKASYFDSSSAMEETHATSTSLLGWYDTTTEADQTWRENRNDWDAYWDADFSDDEHSNKNNKMKNEIKHESSTDDLIPHASTFATDDRSDLIDLHSQSSSRSLYSQPRLNTSQATIRTVEPKAEPTKTSDQEPKPTLLDETKPTTEMPIITYPDEPLNETSFLDWYPQGNATIRYPSPTGGITSITNLNPDLIFERSPLLAAAFERTQTGPQLFLSALNPATATPLLRFLYTGTYALVRPSTQTDIYEDCPSSLLLHAQLHHLADLFDIPELLSQSYVNLLRQVEFACSSPTPPIDLVRGVRFVYANLAHKETVRETLAGYCVTCFESNGLDEDEGFREVAFEVGMFNQDLCRELRRRSFEDESAMAIIRLPFRNCAPEEYASREGEGFAWRVAARRESEGEGGSPRKRKRGGDEVGVVGGGERTSLLTLALRGKPADQAVESGRKSRRVSDADSVVDLSSRVDSDAEYEVVSSLSTTQSYLTDDEWEVRVALRPKDAMSESSATALLPVRSREDGFITDSDEVEDSGAETDWSLV